ncbi:MAG: NAD(+)/NADH kinase [Opitutales bacterium]
MSEGKQILVVVNRTKTDAHDVGQKLEAAARDCGWTATRTETFPLPPALLKGIDLCVVVGGDGSILGVVSAIATHPVPVMGVNLGTLGFMANFSADSAYEELRSILQDSPPPSRRRLLEVSTASGERRWALNDLVVKSTSSRLARVSVHAGTDFVNAYYADGLIFATPTGSTAYNLSAGGPILHADAHTLVVTPINPHSLTNRSIVLDEEVELTVTVEPHDAHVQASADGMVLGSSAEAFPLRVRICPDRFFPLLKPTRFSHFDLLRTRLRWMGETPTRLQGEG